jgi:SAM-dependent methyltransferase
VLETAPGANVFDVWHDHAVFHFLTAPEDRAAYVQNVLRAVKPGGHVIIATFAEDGPTRCSGLPVVRYSPKELHAEFGDRLSLLSHENEAHREPFGTIQPFVYRCWQRLAHSTTVYGLNGPRDPV